MRAIGLARLSSFYGLTLALALVAGWVRGDLAGWLPPSELRTCVLHAALGVAVGLGIVLVTRVVAAQFGWAGRLMQEFRGIVGELSTRDAVLLGLASGVAEEALFRGVLQATLGLWIGAALFGLLHIGPSPRFLPWTLMATASGLLFGAMVQWTGDLSAAVLAHATVNAMNLRYLGAQGRGVGIELGPVGGERAASWH